MLSILHGALFYSIDYWATQVNAPQLLQLITSLSFLVSWVYCSVKYTLYIDESGDFESQKGQWVLSGMLLPDLFDVCEKQLSNKFKLMPRNLDLKSIKSFHLTEFRAHYSPATALDMAQKTLNKLNDMDLQYNLLAVVNYSKISMQEKEQSIFFNLSLLSSINNGSQSRPCT